MHIIQPIVQAPGLPGFRAAEILNYINTGSAVLPILAKIKLPTDIPHAKEIEEEIKKSAVQLAYLRLCEKKFNEEAKALAKQVVADPHNMKLKDELTSINLQVQYVLSLNELITVSTLEYFYFKCLFRNTNPDDKKEISAISESMLQPTLKRQTANPDLFEAVATGSKRPFSDFLSAVSDYIVKKKYQSGSVVLPDLRDVLKGTAFINNPLPPREEIKVKHEEETKAIDESTKPGPKPTRK